MRHQPMRIESPQSGEAEWGTVFAVSAAASQPSPGKGSSDPARPAQRDCDSIVAYDVGVQAALHLFCKAQKKVRL